MNTHKKASRERDSSADAFTSVHCIQSETQCKPTFDQRRRWIRMILHQARCRDHDQTERRMFMDARKLDAQLIAKGYPLEYPSEWGSNWPAECKRKGLPDPFLSLETNFIVLGDTQAPTEGSNPPTEANNGNPQRPPETFNRKLEAAKQSGSRMTRKFGGRHE